MLLEIRPLQRDLNTLVFTDESGNPLSSAVLQRSWNGHTSKINGCEYVCLGVLKELVKKGSLPFYLKPYSTRHTFAIWAITQDVSPDKVAQWIGDKVETVLRYYCHPQVMEADCPDF
ncbi:MAG: hypothetical protein V7L31_01445 [Nostoc sp.]|uniref:hypothetical protein n=1 Tax=Nostoc sp. TaxID=1180 RepID=UPI002FF10CBB